MKPWNLAIGVALAIAAAAPVQVAAPLQKGTDALSSARTAMGGASQLANVKTLLLKVVDRDRMGSLPGASPRPPEYSDSRSEIQIIFPDHFLVVTQMLTPFQSESRWGFAGPNEIGHSRLRWRSAETFGYLALAVLLKTDTLFRFDVRETQGQSLGLRDANGVSVFVDFDPSNSLPTRLRYDEPVKTMDGEPTGQTYSTRIEIGGYATTGALRLARTLNTYRGTTLLRERRIETIEPNAKISLSAFR